MISSDIGGLPWCACVLQNTVLAPCKTRGSAIGAGPCGAALVCRCLSELGSTVIFAWARGLEGARRPKWRWAPWGGLIARREKKKRKRKGEEGWGKRAEEWGRSWGKGMGKDYTYTSTRVDSLTSLRILSLHVSCLCSPQLRVRVRSDQIRDNVAETFL